MGFTFSGAVSPENPRIMNLRHPLCGQRVSCPRSDQEARMTVSNIRRLALAVALAAPAVGCETEGQRIPTITAQAASQLPASQLPRVFKTRTHLWPILTTFMK